ncbi:MAG: hypothetical protein R3C56_27350 [Pirellulaceae bacterium]
MSENISQSDAHMINFQILGELGRDNAVLLSVDSGKAVHKLLFDCGYGCLDSVAIADIMFRRGLLLALTWTMWSGFDYMFRLNYNRSESPCACSGHAIPDASSNIGCKLLPGTWSTTRQAKLL